MKKIILGLCLLAAGVLFGTQLAKIPEAGVSEHASLNFDPTRARIESDLEKTILDILKYVEDDALFSISSCAPAIERVTNELKAVSPQFFNQDKLRGAENRVLADLWKLRQTLRQKLQRFYQSHQLEGTEGLACVTTIRRAFRFTRYIEDYLILWSQKPKSFDEKTDDKAYLNLQGEFPQVMLAPGLDRLRLRSGDALLSRGSAFTSAAIARIGKEDAQFSHLATVYIDAPPGTEFSVETALQDDRVKVIEAHIEVGSFYRPFREYIADGNARIIQYRYPDAELAHNAAKATFDFVDSYQKRARGNSKKKSPDHNPPYDFKMNLKDESEVFCSEGTAIGYRRMGVTVPTFPSEIEKNGLTEAMGITEHRTFAPADMEVEPQFDMIAEWRDPRKITSLHKKDAILSSLFRWMDHENYVFYPDTFDSAKSIFAWTARHMNFGFVQERLPKNMPASTMELVFVLDKVGAVLQHELDMLELSTLTTTQLTPGFAQMVERLESFKADDKALWQAKSKSVKLHDRFRPKD